MLNRITVLLSLTILFISCVSTHEDTGTVLPKEQREEITFIDSQLEAAVRKAVGKPSGSISPTDVGELESLNASNLYISELSGIEHLESLTSLDLSHNPDASEGGQISNLEPLSQLTLLRELRLGNNRIDDISPLASLSSLEVLELNNNQIEDISPLSSLTALTTLKLDNNRISNILPLESLESLSVIDLSYNEISDITPLANLTSLTTLKLKSNYIQDISALQNLSSLSTLDLSGNKNLSDISALTDLPALKQLWIKGAQLNNDALNSHIPSLQKLGVDVFLPKTVLIPAIRNCRIVEEQKGNLVLRDCDGNEVSQLTDHAADDQNPTWSPDGNQIVFHSNRDNLKPYSLYIINIDDVDPRRLTFEHDTRFPAWSPDGERIAFINNCDLALMNPDGTDMEVIVAANGETCSGGPVWAPDSHRLAFTREQNDVSDIYTVMRDGTDLRKLASVRSRYLTLVWTPDGQQVGIRIREPNESIEYLLINADGAGKLTDSTAFPKSWYPGFWPQWLPQ